MWTPQQSSTFDWLSGYYVIQPIGMQHTQAGTVYKYSLGHPTQPKKQVCDFSLSGPEQQREKCQILVEKAKKNKLRSHANITAIIAQSSPVCGNWSSKVWPCALNFKFEKNPLKLVCENYKDLECR